MVCELWHHCGERALTLNGVPVVRSTDNYNIQALMFQQMPEVLITLGCLALALFYVGDALLKHIVIHIAECRTFSVGQLQECPQV